METFFYVMGGVLVLIALGISFLGIRSDRFPSDGMLKAGVLLVAIVVAATAYGAVQLSQDEQQHREDEQNREAATEAEQIAKEDADNSGVSDTGGTQAPGNRQENDTAPAGGGGTVPASQGDPEAGAQVFTDQGCGGCHSLQAAGSTGAVGPNLDTELADKDAAFIETSIVSPDDFIEKGFQPGIMPSDYEDTLTPDDLANLVAFVTESTTTGASSSADSGSGSAGTSSK